MPWVCMMERSTGGGALIEDDWMAKGGRRGATVLGIAHGVKGCSQAMSGEIGWELWRWPALQGDALAEKEVERCNVPIPRIQRYYGDVHTQSENASTYAR